MEGLLPLDGSQLAACYSFTTRTLCLLRADEHLTVSLASTTGEVVAIAPALESANNDGTAVRFAALGLCEMYNGGGAVHACACSHPPHAGGSNSTSGSGATTFEVTVRAGASGRFLAYCSKAPASATANGSSLAFEYDAGTCAFHCQLPQCAGLTQLVVTV